MGLFNLIFGSHCPNCHRKVVLSRLDGLFGFSEEWVCSKCGHHFMESELKKLKKNGLFDE